jgi:hypothetical protein
MCIVAVEERFIFSDLLNLRPLSNELDKSMRESEYRSKFPACE